MQTPATSTPQYRSPIKEHASKQHDDHSSSSSDQLTYAAVTPYGRCPLIPCMPDLKRGSGSVTNQHPISELAGLHAALSSEGVQVLHSPTQRQPHQQYRQHLQQPQLQPPSPLRAGLQQHRQHAGSKQHAAQPEAQLFEPPTDKSAELQRLGTQIHTITAALQGIACREGQQPPSTSSGFLSSRAHGNSTRPSALADPLDARGSLDIKLVDRQVVERLRDELSTVNDNVTQRLRFNSSKAAAAVNAQKQGQPCSSPSTSSRHDAAEHGPPPPSPLAAALQQQQQELLGLAGNSKSASLAASLTQQLAMSQGLQRLLQPRQQQQLANGQDLAQAGLQQLQDITEVGQLLLPALAAERLAVAENQQKLSAVSRVLQAYPEYKDPSALQGLVDSKRDLEVCCEALKRELQAKDTAHRNTLNVLRESTSTPRNKRLAQLHQENITLQQQLMSRDAQLQRYEQELRALRSHAQGSNGELSPVSAEGQRYDDVPPARQVNRTLWGAPLPAYAGLAAPSSQGSTCGSSDGGSSVSGSAGSSRSCTPSSSSSRSGSVAGVGVPPRHGNARQQPQQQYTASAATDMTTQFERQRAAGRAAIPQLQQQLNALREPKLPAAQQDPAPSTASLLRQPGSQATQPSVGDQQQQQQAADAHSSAMQALKAQLQQQFEQQAQQEAAMRASAEATFKRQIERERLQHECTQQRCKLLEGQTQQLQQQLEGSQAQQAGLAAQVKQLQQQLEREQKGSGGGGSSGGAALIDPQQQLQLERSVSDLQGQLSHAQQEKKDLQQRVEQLMAEGQVKESEMKKRANQLLIAEQALMDYGAQKEQLQGLKRRCQELQEQLSTAQQAQATAEGSVQECRRQLAAAEAGRSLLMDRIRQLADRASLSESLQQQVNRSAGGSQGPSADPSGSSGGSSRQDAQQQQQQQLQQELSAACAELNQQVVVLRGRLADSEGKEERLQVANAALQERLGRLQADLAAREAAASSSGCGGSTGDLQRHQQQHDQLRQQAQQLQQQEQQLQQVQQKAAALQAEKQQLEQQVGSLQEQLAAAAAAADADSSHNQQEQQQEQQQPQQEEAEPQQQQEQQHQQQEQQQEQQQHDVEVLQAEVQELQLLLEDRTQELQEWQIHADALEKDLEDLKAQVLAADGLQEQLQHTQAQLAAARAQQQQLQVELSQARDRAQQLDYELHGVGQERSALRSRVDALTSELSSAREGAADLRLRLEAFTGPTGPQARVRQLEASLQNVQRKYEAAESRASSAASRVSELTGQLGGAEDTIVALEGHITLLEEELAKYTQLPQ